MKKTLRIIGLIAILALVGLSFMACDDGSQQLRSNGLSGGSRLPVSGGSSNIQPPGPGKLTITNVPETFLGNLILGKGGDEGTLPLSFQFGNELFDMWFDNGYYVSGVEIESNVVILNVYYKGDGSYAVFDKDSTVYGTVNGAQVTRAKNGNCTLGSSQIHLRIYSDESNWVEKANNTEIKFVKGSATIDWDDLDHYGASAS